MSDFAALAAQATSPPTPETPAAAGETPAAAGGEESVVAHEEESTAQFEPVVQLEEVEVKTHEEDEEVLWKMRSKLFIFGETLLNKGTGVKEWVERGIGEVKFLKHNESGFIRILMRQEKTMKVICNHVVDSRIVLKPNSGSDRSWVWNAFDFAEGKLEEVTFAIRFGKSDSAIDFKEQFVSAQAAMAVMSAPAEAEEAPKEEGTDAPADGEETAATAAAEAATGGSAETDAAADALEKLSVVEQ